MQVTSEAQSRQNQPTPENPNEQKRSLPVLIPEISPLPVSLPKLVTRFLKGTSNEISVRYPFLVFVTRSLVTHFRYPLLLCVAISVLYLAGQTFVASAMAAGYGLYLINTGIDRHFGAALDVIQKRGAK